MNEDKLMPLSLWEQLRSFIDAKKTGQVIFNFNQGRYSSMQIKEDIKVNQFTE